MTIERWSQSIIDELTAAGFEVSTYQGFPLVKRPEAFGDGVRLLKFKTTLAAYRTIYAEGMLFTPERIERS